MVREIRPVERDDLHELPFVARAPSGRNTTSADGAPRRPESANFEPQRLSRGHGRFPVALAAWLGVLALVVGVAFVGQRTGDIRDRAPAQVAIASEVPAVVLQAPEDPIDLLTPEIGPITITTARLTVKGNVMVKASRVVVSLEARNNRTLDSVTFNVSDPDGGIRPTQTPTFSAEFDIPFPRPNGTMWVVVTAYDSHLIPLGGERRPVLIGEIMGWPAAPGVG
jgi:hypothetical protein